MAEIKSLSAIREKRALHVYNSTGAAVIDIETHKPLGKSPSHRTAHFRMHVNSNLIIQRLKRIIELQKQGICLLTQEIEGLKRQ